MIHKIIDWYTNSGVVQFFFWGPVIINGIFYPIHTWVRVQRDLRADKKYHSDYITVGHLFKYLGLTIVPVVNALATIFHVAPQAWDYISKRFAWLFAIRLVGGKEKQED